VEQRLRAGVIGLGHLGRHHARIYAQIPSVDLAALCDTRPEAQHELAPELREIPFFRAPEDLLGHVDIVSIVTPTSTHAALGRVFLENRVPVLVEKPLSASVEEGATLVEAAERTGTLLQVGHVEEFNPALEAARPWLGRPLFVEAHRMGAFSGRSLDVDVACDLMIHDLDLVLEWVGAEPILVHAVGVPVLSSRADMASVRLEFACGTVASLTASRVSFTPQRRIRLFLPERYLRLDFLERSAQCVERRLEPDGTASIQAVPIEVGPDEPLRREIESFVEAVATGGEPRVGGRRALRALKLAISIRTQIDERAARGALTC
jgi:predicted dehydrogenase